MTDYVPALVQHVKNINHIRYTPSSVGIYERSKLKHNEYKLSWWEDNSFYRYDSMLVSVFYAQGFEDFRKDFNIPDDLFLLVDSGGFQNITRETNLTPERVLRWAEKNGQASLTLDYPPVEKVNTSLSTQYIGVAEAEVLRRLKKNAVAGKEMLDKRKTDLELIFVTHGDKWKDMDKAHEMLRDIDSSINDFDGESKVLKNSDPLVISTQLLHTIEKCPENFRFHFLGLSGVVTTIVLYYAMTYRPDLKVTFDSSTYGSAGAIRREYWVQDQRYQLFFTADGCPIEYLPCDCPVCSIVQKAEPMRASGSVPGGLIALHNLWIFLRYTQILAALSNDRDALREFAKKYAGPGIIPALDFIDMGVNRGIDAALSKFGRKVKQNRKKSSSTNSSLDSLV